MTVAPEQPVGRRFDDRPLLVFWETTKACDLACVHCRADAQPDPGPDELSTAEGCALIDELAAIGSPRPILILTGGDCLKRPDILDLAGHAQASRVPVAVAPSVTPRLTSSTLAGLRRRGVRTASVSLDGATPATHDRVRGIDGHFDATLRAIGQLQRHGFSVQVNTTVMRSNLHELADVAALVHKRAVDTWEVFFLITTGRGTGVEATTPSENEDICHFLVDASRYGFTVRTVEAPFFRRVARSRTGSERTPAGHGFETGALYADLRDRLVARLGPATARACAPSAATRDGKGIVFVAANGDVHPSGFLPVRLGNVRLESLLHIYRSDRLLQSIRAAEFTGRCGTCEDADLCGGSRSRAYAETGDALGEDPGCVRTLTGSAAGHRDRAGSTVSRSG
ncbi:MAG: TIGR04053 family radical SAM/SPASM domain-containing protein [Acidimicrobiales bacterium]